MTIKGRIVALALAGIACAGISQAALVGEWNFDNQNFANTGSSGAIHDGTFVTTNSNYFSTNTVDGSGYALVIQSIEDANNVDTAGGDVLLINNSKSDDSGYVSTFDGSAFTVSMWVKSLDSNWTAWDELAGKQIENWQSSPNDGWSLRSTDGTTIRFDSYGAGTAESTTDALDQTWHLITATYDGATMNLYIDGWLEASTNSLISDASLYSLAFGARNDGSRNEDILIDEIQYYDETLSAAEVYQLYASEPALFVTDEVLSLELFSPATTITGSVALSYVADTSVDVAVSISDESHPGAFSLLNTTPMTLTEPIPANTVLEFAFDNEVTGLIGGESATGLVTIAWNLTGDSEVTEVVLPINVSFVALAEDLVFLEELGGSADTVNPLDLSAQGPVDWVMLGTGGDTSVREEKDGADYIGAVTVTGTHAGWADNAYLSSWTDGSPTLSATEVQGSWEAKVDGIISFSVDGLSEGGYEMTVYASKYDGNGELTASFGTKTQIVNFDTDGSIGEARYGVFTINFDVLSPSDSINISFAAKDSASQYSNVGITAITLEQTSLPAPIIGDISIETINGGTDVALSFLTSAHGIYGVEAKAALTSATWDTIIAENISGTGGIVTITNTASATVEFYRAYIQE